MLVKGLLTGKRSAALLALVHTPERELGNRSLAGGLRDCRTTVHTRHTCTAARERGNLGAGLAAEGVISKVFSVLSPLVTSSQYEDLRIVLLKAC